ncbi:MAG: RHS repeat-associated core domain-containing protein [Planctomycetaceae bacterium]
MPVTNYIWDPVTDAYLMEQDENGATTVVYTQEPVPYGNLISQRQTDPATNESHTYYHHYDALGSTRELTDASENIVSTNLYDAWGVNKAQTGTIENPFGWHGNNGYYHEPETNPQYVRARTYTPRTGRWASPDPILFADGGNLYAAYFVPGAVDPTGNYVIELTSSGCFDYCTAQGGTAEYCNSLCNIRPVTRGRSSRPCLLGARGGSMESS